MFLIQATGREKWLRKIEHRFESLIILTFWVCLSNLINNQHLLNKISHQFIVTHIQHATFIRLVYSNLKNINCGCCSFKSSTKAPQQSA
jgi:hypothetical protein